LVPDFLGGRSLMRERLPSSRSPRALRLRKVTVLVLEGSVNGLPQFARELCHQQEPVLSQAKRVWRKLSPSAELMVDPEAGARRAITDTGAPGPDRYRWTVTLFGEPDPVAAGAPGELAEARTLAEEALGALFDG
jgi:hypothetical protein